MKNSFLVTYSTWAGDLSLPKQLTEYFMHKYNLTDLDNCLDLWIFEDFNTYVDKQSSLISLVQSRFKRLNPVLASTGFLTSQEILSLWAIEHIEKDIHVKSNLYDKPQNDIKTAIKSCIQQGLTYTDIYEYYLEKRFTK